MSRSWSDTLTANMGATLHLALLGPSLVHTSRNHDLAVGAASGALAAKTVGRRIDRMLGALEREPLVTEA